MLLLDALVYFFAIPAFALLALAWLGWWFVIPAAVFGLYRFLCWVEASDPEKTKPRGDQRPRV